ncbi:hypothetical protein CBR_g48381 [Chara braunii]|uniref:Endonuclease/exonuclease/phosphatase domain-containing protein n=1 Tax=Chara braunii TaxID=69332 RepID=A0A388M2S1_CHABU|nr:hypothetical protein CBR_g48381 [Chara braunii]|eukprot:GBG88763.1 hypothetical protein CBR_g48381 [Chara braunii]
MLSVLRLQLPSDAPTAGREICPSIFVRKPDLSVTTDDVPESNPVDGYYLRFRWYRITADKRSVAVCSIHPSEAATLQCLGCVKAKLSLSKSYHCSTQCFTASWRQHRAMHARAASLGRENGTEEEDIFGQFGGGPGSTFLGSAGALGVGTGVSGGSSGGPGSIGAVSALSNGGSYPSPARGDMLQSSGNGGIGSGGGETLVEVGRGRAYTPVADDVGYTLKVECAVVEVSTGNTVATPSTAITSRVVPAPCPPRKMILVNGVDGVGGMEVDGSRAPSTGTFTVLSYNILAEMYAIPEMYSYCPAWALSWSYRKQNLLRELLGYRADILCLQEVQSDHFEEFFAPELDKHGYAAFYKRKTTESQLYTGSVFVIDGCATFFRRDRFSLVRKYEVDFNKAAISLSEHLAPAASKKVALSRLLKDNVALIVVLESQDPMEVQDGPGPTRKGQLLCVANTHIHANPELKDVKLWQVHTLLKGLEKIANCGNIPMLVAGDFNSVPGSAPHSLLAKRAVDPSHPDLATDPLGILKPATKLCHQLPLVSAYSALARLPGPPGSMGDRHRRRMDIQSNEPLFTNFKRDFWGTLDYIFYTADLLEPEALLELLDEENLRKDTALPSPEWSSDHIALLAEFRYKKRGQRG